LDGWSKPIKHAGQKALLSRKRRETARRRKWRLAGLKAAAIRKRNRDARLRGALVSSGRIRPADSSCRGGDEKLTAPRTTHHATFTRNTYSLEIRPLMVYDSQYLSMTMPYRKSGKCGNMVWQRARYGQICYPAVHPL
jgi:hypothetical protein